MEEAGRLRHLAAQRCRIAATLSSESTAVTLQDMVPEFDAAAALCARWIKARTILARRNQGPNA